MRWNGKELVVEEPDYHMVYLRHIHEFANFNGDKTATLLPVRSLKPNQMGFHDLHRKCV